MTSAPEQEFFRALPGEWDLRREIPGIGTMTGRATFRPIDRNVLLYREEGSLESVCGQVHPVSREYHYILEQDTGDESIRVCFVEPDRFGRTLHTLRFAVDGRASDVHLCGADRYTGQYAFTPPDRFTVEMDVCGPRKDYSIRSVYDRSRTLSSLRPGSTDRSRGRST